jgi:hypothetical protein
MVTLRQIHIHNLIHNGNNEVIEFITWINDLFVNMYLKEMEANQLHFINSENESLLIILLDQNKRLWIEDTFVWKLINAEKRISYDDMHSIVAIKIKEYHNINVIVDHFYSRVKYDNWLKRYLNVK